MPTDEPSSTSTPPTIDYATPELRVNRLCIVAVIVASIGLVVPLAGPIGLALGIVGIHKTDSTSISSQRLARIAVRIGTAGSLITVVMLIAAIIVIRSALASVGQVQCASNLRQVSQSLLIYSNANRGRYPPDLATLLTTTDIIPDAFLCPRSGSRLNKLGFTSDPTARAANNLDFVYVGEELTNKVNADEPILFERLTDHDHDGGNVLFGDGHVEFITKPQILKLLEPLRNTPRLTDEEYNAIVAK